MLKLETILSAAEKRRLVTFSLADGYGIKGLQLEPRVPSRGRAEASPDNKEKNPDGFKPRRCTCSACPQPYPWLSADDLKLRHKCNYPIFEIGENFQWSGISNGEWIKWGSIQSWQEYETPIEIEKYFYTTRCTPCDSKNRRVSRSQVRINDVINAVGYNKFVTLTIPRLELRTVPTNTEIQKSMKEVAAILRKRLSSRRIMLKKAIGPSTFGYYWLECVVRAFVDDNFEQEVDHDDPDARVYTLHPHIHAVWSSSKKSWDLNIFRDWWSPSNEDENWRSQVVPYSPGQVADYVNKKSINQTMVEYAEKQATYWDSGFRTCNKFGSWSPSAKSKRRILRHHREELFKGEKLSKRELKEYTDQYALNTKDWVFKEEYKRTMNGFRQ